MTDKNKVVPVLYYISWTDSIMSLKISLLFSFILTSDCKSSKFRLKLKQGIYLVVLRVAFLYGWREMTLQGTRKKSL